MVQGNIQHPNGETASKVSSSIVSQSQRSRVTNNPRSSSNGAVSEKQLTSVSQRTTSTTLEEIERLKKELAKEKKMRQEVEQRLKKEKLHK